MSNWVYNGQEFNEIPDKVICFVYIITNTLTDKKYIGKKKFYFLKTKQVKGKKKKYKAESDWKDYYGSNDQLKKDVVEFGTENFKREILKLCTMQSESSYYEAKYQFDFDVLLHPSQFYNGWISLKITSKHLSRFQISVDKTTG